ncbi:Rsc9p SCDLUD_001307 [Saccharomycodes ludwigii]|uniref:Rsc9p n=1 Tax=Saccharomycodes ludwigii TaxID=36035 RepID=UPI001E85EF6F|nr:hypothetical protein SCDLUD_001307 [Saccharomycodes ludwigii]KAH3903659.1 hypothetical protein SCDLUD_001307 [Saccharomycodes ludwigii]
MDSKSNVFQTITPNGIVLNTDDRTVTLEETIVKGPSISIQQHLTNLDIYKNSQLPISNNSASGSPDFTNSNRHYGVDEMVRMKMALKSNIKEEVMWSLRKFLTYSTKAPYLMSLKSTTNLDLLNDFLEILEEFDKDFLSSSPSKKKLRSLLSSDDLFKLQCTLTSLLIIRNLAQDLDNTQIFAANSILKKFLLSLMSFNNNPNNIIYPDNVKYLTEFQFYVLEIMESIASFIAPAKKDDPYFENLLHILTQSKDNHLIISILRSMSRLLVRSRIGEESSADNISDAVLTQIVSYLLLAKSNCNIADSNNDYKSSASGSKKYKPINTTNDINDKLILASLDFLYQYILPGNERLAILLENPTRYSILFTTLPKLLSYNVLNYGEFKTILNHTEVKLIKRVELPPPESPPALPKALYNQILQIDEPKRSTCWLRCCFEPDLESEFTQIKLWRAYESSFGAKVKAQGRRMIPAVDFIKNVSNCFYKACAMVITDEKTNTKRFVIKGIKPRRHAVDIVKGTQEAMAVIAPVTNSSKKNNHNNTKNNNGKVLKPPRQTKLPDITFPVELSSVSNTAAMLLCLISSFISPSKNDEDIKKFCTDIKPFVILKISTIPPLGKHLFEYLENTK